MQEIDNLLQDFFCLVLACDICKFDAGFGLYVHFGVALSKAHRISHAAHHLGRHAFHQPLTERYHHHDRKYPR